MAATITSSVVVSQGTQKDGRIWVQERHTDSLGTKYELFYLAPDGTGIAAHLTASAITVLANAVQAEISNNIAGVTTLGSLFTPTFNYSTVAANVAALRAVYLTATQTQAIMIGDYLNTLTSLQLQTAFGLTAGQVTTLQTNKLIPAATAATTIRAAVGQ